MSRASHVPHPFHRVVEYFTMRRSEAYLRHLGEARRAELAELLDVARQRAAAAQGLWSVGHTVEAMGLVRDALDDTIEVASRFAALERSSPSLLPPPPPSAHPAARYLDEHPAPPGEGPAPETAGAPPSLLPPASPDWAIVLRQSGISDVGIEHARRALAHAHRTDFPRLERDVTREHREIVHDLLRVRLALDDAVSTGTLAHDEIRGTRAMRRGALGLAVLAVVLGVVWALVPARGAFATASGVWASSRDYQASQVLDGDPRTMWILPDGERGWVEVRLAPARRVERVTVVNAGAPVLRDRGTRRYELEIYADGALVRTLEGEFSGDEGATASHELGVDGVERIRFVVLSHRGLGAGLAELRWE